VHLGWAGHRPGQTLGRLHCDLLVRARASPKEVGQDPQIFGRAEQLSRVEDQPGDVPEREAENGEQDGDRPRLGRLPARDLPRKAKAADHQHDTAQGR